MPTNQFYAKTVQHDGAVLQILKGNFGNTQNRLPDCIVLVKYTHIEIITLKVGLPHKDEPIIIQMPIISCNIIEADYDKYNTDLLLVISQTLEVFIMQPTGPIQQLEFQTLQRFNLIEYLQNDKQFKIPFQRRMAPVTTSFSFEKNIRVVVVAYKETEMILQQICFIIIDLNSLAVNLGTVSSYPQQMNMASLITDIMHHPALNRSSKDVPMMPQLGIFAMYSNRYLTYDLLYTQIFSSYEEGQVQWVEDGVMLTEGPMLISNISDFSVTCAFEDEDMSMLFPYLVIGIERIQVVYNLDQIATFEIYDHKEIQLKPMARPLAVTKLYGLKFIATYDDGTLLLIEVQPNFDEQPNDQSSHDASLASWQYQPVYIKVKSLDFPLLPDSRYLRFPSATSIVCLPYKHDNKQEFTYYLFLGSQSVDCLMLKFEQNETLKFVSQSFNSCIGSVQAINVYKNNRFIICTSQGRDGSIITGRFGLPTKIYSQHFVQRQNLLQQQSDERIMNCVSIANVNEPENYIHTSHSFTDVVNASDNDLLPHDLTLKDSSNRQTNKDSQDLLIFISDQQHTNCFLLTNQRSRIKNVTNQEPYCQLFNNVGIIYASRTIDGRLVIATSSYVQISKGPKHVYNIKYVQLIINDLIILTVTGKIVILKVSDDGQGDFQTIKDTGSDYFKLPEIIDFQAQQLNDGIIILAVGIDQQLHMITISANQQKHQTVSFGIAFQRVTFYVANHTLVVLCSYDTDVYFYQLGMNLSVISQKQLMTGHSISSLFAGANEAFVKSEFSIYRLQILKETPRLYPILTQPLNNIMLACLCPEIITSTGKAKVSSKSNENQESSSFQLFSSFGAQYVASIKAERASGLILLADNPVNDVIQPTPLVMNDFNQDPGQRDQSKQILDKSSAFLMQQDVGNVIDQLQGSQRKRAYSLIQQLPTLDIDSDEEAIQERENMSEVPSSMVDFLIYCNVGNIPQFSYRRQFLRRTPTRICYSGGLNVIAVQTEKYLGMQQIRIYVDQRYVQSEVLKLLPTTSMCTHMQFVTIGGKEYLAVALVSTIDIYKELQGLENVSGDQEKEAQTWDTRLEIYDIRADEKKAEMIADLHLDSYQPINYFIQDDDHLLLSVEDQIIVIGASLPLKVIKTINFEANIQQLIKFKKNYYIAIMSRQVSVLNSKFEVVDSMKSVLDVRQLGNIHGNLFYCISSDTVITIFDQNLQIQGQMKVDYNITSHFAHDGRLYIGTDTGAVMVFIQNRFDILKFLQTEIISQRNIKYTYLSEQEQQNIINGDIVQQYLDFDQKTQDDIAFRLNTNTSHLKTILREITFQLGE